MRKQKHQKVINKRYKKKKQFGRFYEENIENQENLHEKKYPYTKRDSSSSLECKTIYSDHNKHSSKNVILKMKEIINDYPEKYYKQHLKSDWAKFLVNLFASLLHIIIIISYINSLSACSINITLNECIEKIDIIYYYKVYLLCFISAFLISLIIILVIEKLISIYQFPFIIIELCAFICINHQDNIYQNGLFSFKLLCFFILISFLFLLFFILFLVRLWKRQYFYSVFFFFAFHLFQQYIYLYI